MRFSGVFLSCKANARFAHIDQDHFIIILSLATDVTGATLGASGLWLGTGDTATLAKSILDAAYESMDNRSIPINFSYYTN